MRGFTAFPDLAQTSDQNDTRGGRVGPRAVQSETAAIYQNAHRLLSVAVVGKLPGKQRANTMRATWEERKRMERSGLATCPGSGEASSKQLGSVRLWIRPRPRNDTME